MGAVINWQRAKFDAWWGGHHMTRIGRLFIAPTSLIVFGVSFAVLEPPAAQADCAQWDLSGHWEIQQRNGFTVHMDLTQTGTDVGGTGSFTEVHDRPPFGQFGAGTFGSITGTIDANGNILLNADWGGVYRGGVGSDAFIGGDTFATNDPGNQVGWRGDRTATCQVAAAEPSATTPPSHAESPLEKSGVLKAPGSDIFKKTTTTSPPPPPPPSAPQVTVLLDVDVCASTAGCDDNTRLGMLPAHTQGVTLVERLDPWYHVKWQGPEGFVYSGEGYVSLKLP
jgi:hypothetical protein